MNLDLDYYPSQTCIDFHNDTTSLVRFIHGGVGLGKTSTCVMDLFMQALNQNPDSRGERRTRMLIVRATYPMLHTAVVPTIKSWFGPEFGEWRMGIPISFTINLPLSDGTRVISEWQLYALDSEQAGEKIRGVELTSAYISEYSELPVEVLGMVLQRCGRYPAKRDGGPTRYGVIGESNPPSRRSDWFTLFETDRPDGYKLFKNYPSLMKVSLKTHPTAIKHQHNADFGFVLHPQAENLQNVGVGGQYWLAQVSGKKMSWIQRFLMGEYASPVAGTPVFEGDFDETEHVSRETLRVEPGLPAMVSLDWGIRHSAVTIMQLSSLGQLRVLDSKTFRDVALDEMLPDYLMPLLRNKYRGCTIEAVGDPSGARSSIDKRTPFVLCAQHGLRVKPAYTNNPATRIQGVRWFMTRRGKFTMDPSLEFLREALTVGYIYKRVAGEDTGEVADNEYTHECLVAGTLVATDKGPVPIEQVIAGMRVYAPDGRTQRVLVSEKTGVDRPVIELSFTTGKTITCTPDHPIFTKNRGFICADMLGYDDILESREWGDQQNIQCRNLTGSGTTNARADRTTSQTPRNTRRQDDTCTLMCGSTSSGLSLKASTYTISTGMLEIIASRICSAWTGLSTAACTQKSTLRRIGKKLLDIWSAFAQQLPRGTRVRQDENGTGRMLELTGHEGHNTAALAQSAASLSSTGTPSPYIAPALASRKHTGFADVYNLQIEGIPVFYANGILVHNSDTLSYGAMSLGPRAKAAGVPRVQGPAPKKRVTIRI